VTEATRDASRVPVSSGSPAAGREPLLVITGASGFLGRHLIAALRDRYRIVGLARRAPSAVGLPRHHHVSWLQADIAEKEPLQAAFHALRSDPAPKVVIHLAAFYDFTGERDPEYQRTNVEGLRNVLDLCKEVNVERFVFASSVAACSFPPPGQAVDEASPPDAHHEYAVTKRRGEEMVKEYAAHFPSTIVRLGAMFSDWCEYPPLYTFLGTWVAGAWNRRILGGKGQSAIAYLHVRSAVDFFARLLERHGDLEPGAVVIASTDGSVSHAETFEAATLAFFGHRVPPILMPKPIARVGLHAMDLAGRLRGSRPFERPWMGRYIDLKLTTSASRTRARLGWAPNPRLEIIRRMPFLVENLKNDPIEWHRRNLAAMKTVQLQPNLRLLGLFEAHEREILEASMSQLFEPDSETIFPTYRKLGEDELRWAKRQLFLQLKNTIRTRDVSVFKSYCRHLAERRFHQGFDVAEVSAIIASERDLCFRILRTDPRSAGLESALHDHVAMTFLVGLDEIEDTYEQLSGRTVAVEPWGEPTAR